MKLNPGDRDDMVARVTALGPWHFDYVVLPGVRTGDCNREDYQDPDLANIISVVDPNEMRPILRRYYPNGLAGKAVLDVACNSGGYCFLAHSLGAERVCGVELRQHWLDQAEFIRAVMYPGSSNVEFRRLDIHDYLKSTSDTFDVTIVKGIFYHLPDPIGVLDRLCELTREWILVDSDCRYGIPEASIIPVRESTTHVMSGAAGLAWLPGGPPAINPILEYKGFAFTEIVYWRRNPDMSSRGRFRLVGSRSGPPI